MLPLDALEWGTDSSQPWQTLALPHDGVTSIALEGGHIGPVAPNATLLRVEAAPETTKLNLTWAKEIVAPDCHARVSGSVTWSLGDPAPGTVAMPGKGVRVWYAGFWENGTLFDTNIAAIDKSDWPRAGWYGTELYEPLAVYVYNTDRGERAPIWAPGTSSLPSTVPRPAGNVDPLWTYYTTIKGFNEGLKGLSTSTTRVVWMSAADAYGGRTDVPAGLDAPLVFVMKIALVEDQPCTGDPMACGLPVGADQGVGASVRSLPANA